MMRLLALGLMAAILGASSPARGYVRTLSSHGNPIFWAESCVFLVPPASAPSELTEAEMMAAIEAAASTWSEVATSYVRLVIDPAQEGLRAEYLYDSPNVNAVVFVAHGWPHDPNAAGLTTLTYIASDRASEDGRIFDADVELNEEQFDFSTTGAPALHDLQNVLTHELGHVLGLDHTCDDGLITPTPVDENGATIPACYPIAALPPKVTEATMFNFAYPGETSKRDLSADDIAGVTAIYPLAEDPHRCEPPTMTPSKQCGCASGSTTLPGVPGVLALGLLLGWRRRRRRRARVEPPSSPR